MSTRAILFTRPQANIPFTLPDTFYVQFDITYDSTEINDNGGLSIFNFTGTDGIHTGYLDLYPFASGSPPPYDTFQTYMQWQSSSQHDEYVVTINADTLYTVGLKLEFNPGHTSCDITTKLDASVLGTLTVTPETAWFINEIELGNNGGSIANRTYSAFKIGTSDYGDSDLMSAEFTVDESPFNNLETSGAGTAVVSGGNLEIETPSSGSAFAKRIVTI